MIRQPAVAGMFYPGNEKKLTEMIENCFKDKKIGPGELPDKTKEYERKGQIMAVIAPHAGYIYSGPIAAHGYLQQYKDGKPQFFVIIGPNHRNIGPPISVYPEGTWKTPLGDAKIPKEIVEQLTKQPYFRADTAAHMMEHSLEVQVPFLQYLYGADISILPICVKDQSKEMSTRIGATLSKVLSNYDFCLIASTDLTHYESAIRAKEKDQFVIKEILELDSDGLLATVEEHSITMCGPGPVSAILKVARDIEATDVEILKYASSGEVSGDHSSVVAYLSAIIRKIK